MEWFGQIFGSSVNPISPTIAAKRIIDNICNEYQIDLSNYLIVHDEQFYVQILTDKHSGIAQAYVDGLWDAEYDLGEDVTNLLSRIKQLPSLPNSFKQVAQHSWDYLFNLVFNPQSTNRSLAVANEEQITLGVTIYEFMLGPSMVYSCGRWIGGNLDLTTAIETKLNQIIVTMQMQQQQHVIDLGCGWGGTVNYLDSQLSNTKVCGISNSNLEIRTAKSRYPTGLFHRVDYRALLTEHPEYRKQMNTVLGLNILEFIGPSNYASFFIVARELLTDNGSLLLEVVCAPEAHRVENFWLTRNIASTLHLPALSELIAAAEPYFYLSQVIDCSYDYALTMDAWYNNFTNNIAEINVARIKHGQVGLDERFQRKWRYYLQVGSALFKTNHLHNYQIILHKR